VEGELADCDLEGVALQRGGGCGGVGRRSKSGTCHCMEWDTDMIGYICPEVWEVRGSQSVSVTKVTSVQTSVNFPKF
jgi:hypothetical protein